MNIVSTNKEILFLITTSDSKDIYVDEILDFEKIVVRRIDFYLELHCAFLERTHTKLIQN